MNLASNLFDTTEKFPDRTAIVFYDRRITYQECCTFVSKLAAALQSRGLEPGDRLAIALPNIPEFVFTYYATLTAGGAIIPINPLYTAREIGYMLRDSGAKFIVTHPMFEQAVKSAIKDKDVELLYGDNMGDPSKTSIAEISKKELGITPIQRESADTAVIAYTNACEGWPLGAELTHGGLLYDTASCTQASGINEEDAFLTIIPLYHAFSATTCMNLPFASGAMTVLNELFIEKRVVEALETEPISIFPAVPTIFRKLLEAFGSSGKDFSSVKAFVPGGAPSGKDLIQNFASAFNANVFEGYGITECGPVTTVNPITENFSKIGSVGKPLPGISIKVCDPDGNELASGEQGELWVKGGNVMKCYWKQPELTQKYLTDGWFHTGDKAYMDEQGFIFLTGLIKRMVLVGGFNVYPPEVERILNEHPSVKKCTIFGVDDPILGQQVAADVTLNPGATLTNIEVKKFVRANLAPYKMPRSITIHDE